MLLQTAVALSLIFFYSNGSCSLFFLSLLQHYFLSSVNYISKYHRWLYLYYYMQHQNVNIERISCTVYSSSRNSLFRSFLYSPMFFAICSATRRWESQRFFSLFDSRMMICREYRLTTAAQPNHFQWHNSWWQRAVCISLGVSRIIIRLFSQRPHCRM